MKTKTYRNGTLKCRTYITHVGNGWEVGCYWGTKLTFVGNFVHSNEATTWYGLMNREIRTFTRKYKVGPNCSKTWYGTFLTKQLYKRYYNYLDAVFTKHTRTYGKAFSKEARRYKRMTRNWTPSQRTPFLRAA